VARHQRLSLPSLRKRRETAKPEFQNRRQQPARDGREREPRIARTLHAVLPDLDLPRRQPIDLAKHHAYAAYPLYLVGGDRAVLLLPMLGALVCALAARALARRLGGGDGWAAFWIIGLASPVAIYALDFWEHSIGLALMLWGVVLASSEGRGVGVAAS